MTLAVRHNNLKKLPAGLLTRWPRKLMRYYNYDPNPMTLVQLPRWTRCLCHE